jgi:hypothetical protein
VGLIRSLANLFTERAAQVVEQIDHGLRIGAINGAVFVNVLLRIIRAGSDIVQHDVDIVRST